MAIKFIQSLAAKRLVASRPTSGQGSGSSRCAACPVDAVLGEV